MIKFDLYILESKKDVSEDEAKEIGDKLKVDWKKTDIHQFMMGLKSEREHMDCKQKLRVAKTMLDVAKIALVHLEEMPDYYTKLEKMEKSD